MTIQRKLSAAVRSIGFGALLLLGAVALFFIWALALSFVMHW